MAGEDPDYTERVRRMICRAPGCFRTPCEAHHPRVGVVGLAQRGHDDTAIPLCSEHHRDLHALAGTFKTWDGATLREWQLQMVENTRAVVQQQRAQEVPLLQEEDIPF